MIKRKKKIMKNNLIFKQINIINNYFGKKRKYQEIDFQLNNLNHIEKCFIFKKDKLMKLFKIKGI